MIYEVKILPAAARDIRRLDRQIQRRILVKLRDLEIDPRDKGTEKLSGTDVPTYRVRVADYRILYLIDDDTVLVTVVRVRHRSDVYRNL